MDTDYFGFSYATLVTVGGIFGYMLAGINLCTICILTCILLNVNIIFPCPSKRNLSTLSFDTSESNNVDHIHILFLAEIFLFIFSFCKFRFLPNTHPLIDYQVTLRLKVAKIVL